MPHNGMTGQVNLDSTHLDTCYPFLNHVKQNRGWLGAGSTHVDPTKHDSNGWLTETYAASHAIQFPIPLQSKRPGNYVLKWNGNYTFSIFSSTTPVSGSLSGLNGRYAFTPGSAVTELNLAITAVTTYSANIDVRVCHVDDEALLDSGEIFQTRFLEEVAKFGVIRFVNTFPSATSTIVKWSEITPLTHFTWARNQIVDVTKWCGATTNSGDDYTATLSGFVLEDKTRIFLRYNSTATTNKWRLRVYDGSGYTAYAPIFDQFACIQCDGSFNPLNPPTIGTNTCLIYDSRLGCWLQSNNPYNLKDAGYDGGWPIEVVVALCNRVGAHPWICSPYLSCDPPSDFALSLTQYLETNLDDGLYQIREAGPNESWNPTFPGAKYANSMEAQRTCSNWIGYWEIGTVYAPGDGIIHKNGAYICKAGQGHTADADNEPDNVAPSTTYWSYVTDWDEWTGRTMAKVGTIIKDELNSDLSKYRIPMGVWTSVSTVGASVRCAAARYVSEGGVSATSVITHIACDNYWQPVETGTANETTFADEYATATAVRKLEILEEYMTSGGLGITNCKTNKLLKWWNFAQALSPAKGVMPYEGAFAADRTGGAGHPATQNVYDLRIAAYNSSACKHQTYLLYKYAEDLGIEFMSQYLIAANNSYAGFFNTIYDERTAGYLALNNFSRGVIGYRLIAS